MPSTRQLRLDADERRFWSALLLASGPALQLGGWLAAFTDVGAAFVWCGTAMSLVGFLLRPRAWTLVFCIFGLLIGGWGWLVFANTR